MGRFNLYQSYRSLLSGGDWDRDIDVSFCIFKGK